MLGSLLESLFGGGGVLITGLGYCRTLGQALSGCPDVADKDTADESNLSPLEIQIY